MAEKLQTIKELRHYLRGMFAGFTDTDEAMAMAALIIEEYTGLGSARQLAFSDTHVDPHALGNILSAAGRAVSGEPLQYIFGHVNFCGHYIEVAPGVLIPRPETEEMTSLVIRESEGFKGTAADLCTGSGCIAIALSAALPGSVTYAVDVSEKAIGLALRNASRNKVKINLIRTDILTASPDSLPLCGLIVSNPPYVREGEKALMKKNVLQYEPHEALFVPDEDPLIFCRRIAMLASNMLEEGGRIYMEINEYLGEETQQVFVNEHFTDVRILKDIRGKDRFLKAIKYG